MTPEESPLVFDKRVGKIHVYDIVSQYATAAANLLPVGNNIIIKLNCIPHQINQSFFQDNPFAFKLSLSKMSRNSLPLIWSTFPPIVMPFNKILTRPVSLKKFMVETEYSNKNTMQSEGKQKKKKKN